VLLRGTSLGNADVSQKHPPPYLQMLAYAGQSTTVEEIQVFSNQILCHGASASGISNCTDTVQGQLNRYVAEFEQSTVDEALGFWAARRSSRKLLAPLAEDFLAAPASQAFVERIFSVCGLMTTGRRNRMCKSLEMRAFLKLNRNVC